MEKERTEKKNQLLNKQIKCNCNRIRVEEENRAAYSTDLFSCRTTRRNHAGRKLGPFRGTNSRVDRAAKVKEKGSWSDGVTTMWGSKQPHTINCILHAVKTKTESYPRFSRVTSTICIPFYYAIINRENKGYISFHILYNCRSRLFQSMPKLENMNRSFCL